MLYGGAIDKCVVYLGGKEMDGFTAFKNISNVIPDSNTTTSDITSDPLRVCFCKNGSSECLVDIETVSVRKGQTFSFSVVSEGQANMTVPSTITAYLLYDDDDTELSPHSLISKTHCTDVDFKIFSVPSNNTLVIFPGGPCGSVTNATKSIQINFEPCPAGFVLGSNGDRCVCEERLLKLNVSTICNIDNGFIERPKGAWMKPDSERYAGFII